MRRRPSKQGQALIEYALLFVMLAVVGVAVIGLAGNSLVATYQDIEVSLTHLGTDVSGPSEFVCPDGSVAVLHGHKYHCHP